MRAGILRVRSNVQPELMHQFNVLRAQTRVMRSQGILANAAVGSVYLHNQPWTWLWQALPGIAGKLGLLIGAELIREAADDPAGTQALRRHHNRFEYVRGWHHEKMNGLAFFFRHSYGSRKQFLFVVIEDLAGFEKRAAA